MNLKTTAGEPISTSRKQLADVEPGASAMASRAASLQCRTGGVACMAGSAPGTPEGLERSRRSNWKHGHYSAKAKRVRREARQQFRVLRQLIAVGNKDDFLDLISSM